MCIQLSSVQIGFTYVRLQIVSDNATVFFTCYQCTKPNMKKQVILLIPPKRKCIKYRLKENISELQTIREALFALRKTDVVLKMMIKEKLIVFQRSDPDYDGEWLDIEEDDIIEDKSQIKVVLIPMLSDITVNTSNRENFSIENVRDGGNERSRFIYRTGKNRNKRKHTRSKEWC